MGSLEFEDLGRARSGDLRARERLIESQRQSVVKQARRMIPKCGAWCEIGDLVTAGLLGVNKAIDQFDETRGCRFSYYAGTKVHFEMRKESERLRFGPFAALDDEDDELEEEDTNTRAVDKYFWRQVLTECLKPLERRIVRMSIWEEMSLRDISRELGISETEVERLYNYSLYKIRTHLSEHHPDNAAFEQV